MTNIENAQIKQLSDKIDEIHALKEKDSKDIREIKDALLGNDYNINGGIVKRLEMIEEWRSSVQLNMNKTQTHWDIIKAYGGFAAGAIAIVYEIVTAFFKK